MRTLLKVLLAVAPVAVFAQQPDHQYTPLEASLIRDNVCSKPDVQAKMMGFYNSHEQMTSMHGKIVSVANIQTKHVSIANQDLTCGGDFGFADGSTRKTDFGFPFDFRQP